jgi:hypothetical protein
MPKITRRDWMLWFGGLFPSAMILGCQNNSGNAFHDAPPPDSPEGTPVGIVQDNHSHAPHLVTIPDADVAAGTTQTYDIRNCANHCHTITVTAADFAMLSAGMVVTVNATADVGPPADCPDPNAHTHVVLLKLNTCPETTPDACAPVSTCDLGGCDGGGTCS